MSANLIEEKIFISTSEEKILKSLIGKTLIRVSAINPYEVGILPIQPVYIDFGDAI